ncbi:hypothetical protein QCD66_35200 [Polymorphospora sp. A560]
MEISEQTIYNWHRQELIDTGQMPGVSSADQAKLVAARRRIAELETELAVHRRAAGLPSSGWLLMDCRSKCVAAWWRVHLRVLRVA